MKGEPKPITEAEQRKRLKRIAEISTELGFVGSVEYRHLYTRSGGGQYCIGPSAEDDIIILYAEAFERDADPNDFSLEAIIAHECGHQKLIRDPKMKAVFAKAGPGLEEVLASLIGSLLLGEGASARMLLMKGIAEVARMGLPDEDAVDFVEEMRGKLEELL